MNANPLHSLRGYSRFLAKLLDQPAIQTSTVTAWSDSPYTGIAEGEVLFASGLRLRMREEVDFDAGIITSYGYEVHRGEERLYWYDDFPHPNDPTLASTMPITSMCRQISNTIGFLHLAFALIDQTCHFFCEKSKR